MLTTKNPVLAETPVITGVTILNDTRPDLLDLARPGASAIAAGPKVGMLPQAFFKRGGVTTLGSLLVTRPDDLLDVISESVSFFGRSAERPAIRPAGKQRP